MLHPENETAGNGQPSKLKGTKVKFILAIFLAATAFAQSPASIKVRIGLDKKHKPVYATAEVRKGWIMSVKATQTDATYEWIGHSLVRVEHKFIGYVICGDEATYLPIAYADTAFYRAHTDVNYAVVGKKFFIVSDIALQAGVVDDKPLDTLGITQPPLANLDVVKAAALKADAVK